MSVSHALILLDVPSVPQKMSVYHVIKAIT